MRLDRFNPFTPFGWLLVAGTIITVVTACQPTTQGTPSPEATPTPIVIVEPVDHSNGVLYFPATGDQYIASLVKFYEGNGKHCDLQGTTEKVVEYCPGCDSSTRHTETTGFILHCHDIALEAQELTRE